MNAPQRPCLGLCIGLSLTVLAGCRQGDARGIDHAAGAARIAAASSFSVAFRELEAAFEHEHGLPVTMVYGASGQLAAQIRQGAPFDAFYAADETFASQVVEAGACDGSTRRIFARVHLVVWTQQPESALPLVGPSSLRDPGYRRIAIADPDEAAFGRAAREVLERSGLWAELAPRIVIGADALKTLQLVESGQAEATIVPLSLVMQRGGRHLPLDGSLHAPLVQVAVLCKHGKRAESARAFERFLASERGTAILRRHGYVVSTE